MGFDFNAGHQQTSNQDLGDPGRTRWTPGHTPPKGAISNLESGEVFEFQFNPPSLVESFEVNYARHSVPGLGYQVLQYINTNNNQLTIEIYLSAILADMNPSAAPLALGSTGSGPRVANGDPAQTLNEIKKFLQSLAYPVLRDSGGWVAPPLALFVWPKVIRMLCAITSVEFTHQKFAHDTLETTALIAAVTLEEVVRTQRSSGIVRRQGSLDATAR